MASFNDSLKIILKNEGGYNCAYTGSGETYKGIDRNYSNNWQGWAIIDKAKQVGKIDANCSKRGEQYINSSLLDGLVNGWYSTQLLPYFGNNFSIIKNQTLATFLADFMWHKPYRTIPIVNKIVTQIAPNTFTSNNSITPQAISIINKNSTVFYKMLRLYRLQYYKNPQSINNNWDEKFVKSLQGLINRVNSFPTALSWWSWIF